MSNRRGLLDDRMDADYDAKAGLDRTPQHKEMMSGHEKRHEVISDKAENPGIEPSGSPRAERSSDRPSLSSVRNAGEHVTKPRGLLDGNPETTERPAPKPSTPAQDKPTQSERAPPRISEPTPERAPALEVALGRRRSGRHVRDWGHWQERG